MALIVTLGILAAISLAVVALVITLRIDRLAARNTSERAAARQYVDVGLAQALEIVDCACLGRVYPVRDWLATNDATASFPLRYYGFQGGAYVQPPARVVFSNCVTHFQDGDCLGTPATNTSDTIRLFRGSITNLVPTTLAGQASNVLSGWTYITETNSQSGSAVTNSIIAGRVAFLVINLSGFMDAHFLNETRRKALNEPDLSTPAWSLISGLTNGLTNGLPRTFLSQLDLNAANNGRAVSNLVTLSYDARPDVYLAGTNQDAWLGTRGFASNLVSRYDVNALTNVDNLDTVAALLNDAGVSNATQVAFNLYNYITPGQIPQPDGMQFYRTDYGVKDVPLVNEVALQQLPGTTNHYGVSVELWYPFVPHDAPRNSKLWVGVYTNRAALDAEFASFSGNHDQPPPPLGFELPLPQMTYAGSNEFFVGSTTYASVSPVLFEQVIIVSLGPPLITRTNYLPVSSDNPVWIWPRVYVGDTCVDEALVDATPGAAAPVRTWTSVGSLQFADPRANATYTQAAFDATTNSLGATNINCTVCAPLVLADAPMTSAGELRHIYAPDMTNACLDLATPQGAACRDRFTVRATNAPMRGLVQANTPYTNIWQALMSDIPIGWTNSITSTLTNVADLTTSDPQALAAVVAGSLSNTDCAGWIRFQEMLPNIASNLEGAVGSLNILNDPLAVSQRGDLLAGIADRVSFGQNVLLVVVCGQRRSPLGRTLADQRAAAVVVRDAFTGRWVVNSLVWLTE